MMKVLKGIFGIIGVVVLIGMFAGGSGSRPAESSAQASTPKETFRTSAQQLFAAYEANEVATDEKLKGKIIEVSGVVQSIDKDFTDSIVVALVTSNQFMPARMGIKDSEKQKAIALTKGQKVVVVCEQMSRLVGAPSGRDCVFSS